MYVNINYQFVSKKINGTHEKYHFLFFLVFSFSTKGIVNKEPFLLHGSLYTLEYLLSKIHSKNTSYSKSKTNCKIAFMF